MNLMPDIYSLTWLREERGMQVYEQKIKTFCGWELWVNSIRLRPLSLSWILIQNKTWILSLSRIRKLCPASEAAMFSWATQRHRPVLNQTEYRKKTRSRTLEMRKDILSFLHRNRLQFLRRNLSHNHCHRFETAPRLPEQQ